MSKILNATSNATGIVSVEGQVVPGVQVLSEGKQSSSGLLFLEDDKKTYLPSSATDVKSTIEKTISALDKVGLALTKIADTLTAIGLGMTGGTTAPPPSLPTNVADITAKVTEINAVKSELETLKGALK